MDKTIKILFLIAALVIPSMVYIFLRGFGENKFEIPVYYPNGLTIEGCSSDTSTTHLVKFENYKLQGAQLFYFPKWVNSNEFYRQCERIMAKPYQVVFIAIADTTLQSKLGNTLVVADENQLFNIANCALVLGQEVAIAKPIFNRLVLVDAKKRIRGYYNGADLEDMDRLDIELDILSKEKDE